MKRADFLRALLGGASVPVATFVSRLFADPPALKRYEYKPDRRADEPRPAITDGEFVAKQRLKNRLLAKRYRT